MRYPIQNCPACGTRVLPTQEGTCPACRRHQFGPPAASPSAVEPLGGEEGTALGAGAGRSAVVEGLHRPYASPEVNFLYNLLFCDEPQLFGLQADAGRAPWPALLTGTPDLVALQEIADDETREGRVRALAYNRLRAAGVKVPPKRLLAVIVEVALDGGLDTLAAFSEGGVRYLNQSGKVAIFEGASHPVESPARELLQVAQPVVDQIGPWEERRLPPPPQGDVRMTFLVSDGLYFGQGAFEVLEKEPMGGPVIRKAAQLLRAVTAAVAKAKK